MSHDTQPQQPGKSSVVTDANAAATTLHLLGGVFDRLAAASLMTGHQARITDNARWTLAALALRDATRHAHDAAELVADVAGVGA